MRLCSGCLDQQHRTAVKSPALETFLGTLSSFLPTRAMHRLQSASKDRSLFANISMNHFPLNALLAPGALPCARA